MSMKKVMRDIVDAADGAGREMRDGISTMFRRHSGKQNADRGRIRDTDRYDGDAADPEVPARRPAGGGGQRSDAAPAVEELDVGTYAELRRREVVGDRMQHDHIPSSAAIVRARELELGRKLTGAERSQLHRDAIAVELRDELHALSRTFRGRNTTAQIDLDARDLAAAADRDYAALRRNLIETREYPDGLVDEVIATLREFNARRRIGS